MTAIGHGLMGLEVEDDAVADHGAFGQDHWHHKKDAKLALDELNTLVVRELKKEGSIRLAGLGIFRKRKLAARVGRNPATGEQIRIPARTRLRFTPAKALKESVLGVPAAGGGEKETASKPKTAAAKAAKKK